LGAPLLFGTGLYKHLVRAGQRSSSLRKFNAKFASTINVTYSLKFKVCTFFYKTFSTHYSKKSLHPSFTGWYILRIKIVNSLQSEAITVFLKLFLLSDCERRELAVVQSSLHSIWLSKVPSLCEELLQSVWGENHSLWCYFVYFLL